MIDPNRVCVCVRACVGHHSTISAVYGSASSCSPFTAVCTVSRSFIYTSNQLLLYTCMTGE